MNRTTATITWDKLGPGIYHSSAGEMRIIAGELLQAQGRPNTLVNRIKVCEAAKRIIARRSAAPVIVTNDPPPPEIEVSNV